jgi:hypothetical protein
LEQNDQRRILGDVAHRNIMISTFSLTETWNVWQSFDRNCPKLQPKLCSSSSKLFEQNSSEIIADFWKGNHSIECEWHGIPLQAEWQKWSEAAQTSSMSTLTQPHASLFRAHDDSMEFWLLTDAKIEKYLSTLAWNLYIALAANLLLALVGFAIMWCIAVTDSLPAKRRLMDAPFCRCSKTTFTFCFWALVVCSWTFGGWFSIQTVLTVDTCSTDISNAVPLELVTRFQSQHPASTPFTSFWKNVLQECPSKTDNDGIVDDSFLKPLESLMEPTRKLSSALQSLPPKTYFDICGVAAEPLQDVTLKLQNELCGLHQALHDAEKGTMICEQWLSTYASLKNDTLCNQGSKALVWLTATQLIILVMAVLIWTICQGIML